MWNLSNIEIHDISSLKKAGQNRKTVRLVANLTWDTPDTVGNHPVDIFVNDKFVWKVHSNGTGTIATEFEIEAPDHQKEIVLRLEDAIWRVVNRVKNIMEENVPQNTENPEFSDKTLLSIEWTIDNEYALITLLEDTRQETPNGAFLTGTVTILKSWNLIFSQKCNQIKLAWNILTIWEWNFLINITRIGNVSNPHDIENIIWSMNNLATRNYAINNLKQNGMLLGQEAYTSFRSDRTMILEAIKQNGLALQFASFELQNDDELIRIALSSNFTAYEILAPDKKQNPEFAHLYNENNRTFEYVLSRNGMSIWEPKYATARNIRRFAILAVTQNGLALQFLSSELKDDPDIVLTAVKQNWLAYRFITRDPLRYAQEIVMWAINSHSWSYALFDTVVKNDPILMRFLVLKDYHNYNILEPGMKNDLNIMAAAASQSLLFMIQQSAILSNDSFIVGLMQNYEEKILNQVIRMNEEQLNMLPEKMLFYIFNRHKEVAIHWLHVTQWQIMSKIWRFNPNYILELVVMDNRILSLLPTEIRTNENFLRIATQIHPALINQIQTSTIINRQNISNVISWNLQTLLTYLSSSGNVEIKNLAQKVISTWDLNVVNDKRQNLLMLLIAWSDPNSENYCNILLEQEWIGVNQVWENNYTPLNLAVTFKRQGLVRKILEKEHLYIFKLPKGNGIKTMKWYMKDNGMPPDIIQALKWHRNYSTISNYI